MYIRDSEGMAGSGGKERKGGWMDGMRMNHHLLPKSGISCGVASVGNINGFLAVERGGLARNGLGMRNDGSNEGREGCCRVKGCCRKWGLLRNGGVHFHAQSVKAPPMMTIMSVNTVEGKRRLDDDGNGRSIIMGWETMATSFFWFLCILQPDVQLYGTKNCH